MNAKLRRKLESLRADYERVKGQSFVHFYCPMLFRDEDVELCEAHIVNRAFRNSSRRWAVQRKDIDNFYGSNFESDFVDIQYAEKGFAEDVIADKALRKKFAPKITIDGEPIEYFVAQGDFPEQFTRLRFEDDTQDIDLGLKISPDQALSLPDKTVELEVFKDVTIPALVSLIKAAHLTLFDLIGYRYALSTAGYFVGRQILGEFYLQNRDKPKSEILANARTFLAEYVHMVRPVEDNGLNLKGTITDSKFIFCGSNPDFPWARIIFVKTAGSLNAVMIPISERQEAVVRFDAFLRNKNDQQIEATLCQWRNDHYTKETATFMLPWPKQHYF